MITSFPKELTDAYRKAFEAKNPGTKVEILNKNTVQGIAYVRGAKMLAFLVLTSVTFCLFGFVIGIWADGWEKLNIVPALIVAPLAFLGGSFYSINMLPPLWQKITLLNPVVYLVSGFRWSFYGVSDVSVGISLGMTAVFMLLCLAILGWIFRTGYKLKA